jgi:hypothetical protein
MLNTPVDNLQLKTNAEHPFQQSKLSPIDVKDAHATISEEKTVSTEQHREITKKSE